jgi:hypothetical protein
VTIPGPAAKVESWRGRALRILTPWATEAVVVVGIIFLYQLTKLRVVVVPEVGLAHGRDVATFERAIGMFWEPTIHRFVADETSWMPVLRWLYLNLHFPVTLGFLIWVRYRHRDRYKRIRDGFAIGHVIALIVFVAYPCAPPRMFPELGFLEVLHLPYEGTHNPMAVIPSMHFGYASLVGFGLISLDQRPWVRTVGGLYLALSLFIIVATAAHFIIDAPLGTLTIAMGLAVTGTFKRNVDASQLLAGTSSVRKDL